MTQTETQALTIQEAAPQPPTTVSTAVARPLSTNSLASEILAVSAELNAIDKAGKNNHAGYTFAKMPDVIRELAPKMAAHGILITQSEKAWATSQDGVLRILFQFDITHAPTGEVITLDRSGTMKVTGAGKGYNDKASAAIATMVRKYLMIELFNAVVDDLPDEDQEQPHNVAELRPPAPNPMQQGQQVDSRLLEEWDRRLGEAAQGGMESLRAKWLEVPRGLRDYLLAAVERRHKVLGEAVDRQKQAGSYQ